MYELEITPEEWNLVYAASFAPDGFDSGAVWAHALINSPIWSDEPAALTVDQATPLDKAFRKESTDGVPTFPGLGKNTLLFFKLQEFCNEFTLDMVAQENG